MLAIDHVEVGHQSITSGFHFALDFRLLPNIPRRIVHVLIRQPRTTGEPQTDDDEQAQTSME